VADVTVTGERDQLAWEDRWRRPAAAAAAAAGILTLAGSYYSLSRLNADAPEIGELQAIAPALNGQLDAAVSPRTALVQYIDDKSGEFLATNVVLGLGTLAIGLALWFLFRAAKARRPETPDIAKYTIFFGAVTLAIGGFIRQILLTSNAGDYVAGTDRSRDAVEQVFTGGGLGVLSGILVAGQLALAFGFILTSLHAMRAGLLTRFMGVLGIIVGVLFVIPVASPLPVVQCFWLIALAPLFLGKWPNGVPPAWRTGRAEPWPSQQQLREARQRQLDERRGGDAAAPGEDDAAEPAPAPSPSASKKRRKRRR
jgi:hypothetical protein